MEDLVKEVLEEVTVDSGEAASVVEVLADLTVDFMANCDEKCDV